MDKLGDGYNMMVWYLCDMVDENLSRHQYGVCSCVRCLFRYCIAQAFGGVLIDVARELLFSIQSLTIQLNSIKEFTNQ